MAEEKEKPVYNGETFGKYIREQKIDSLENSIKAYDKFNEVARNQYKVGTINPGLDNMTNKIGSVLEEKLGGIDAKVSNKKDEVEGAIKEGLMSFFKIYMPSIAKAAEDLDDKKKLDYLANEFAKNAPQISKEDSELVGLLMGFVEQKDATVGQIKDALFNMKAKYSERIFAKLNSIATNHLLGSYQDKEISDYLEKDFKTKGIEVEDKLKYMQSGKQLLQLREYLKRGASDMPYEQFGLVDKNAKKEEEQPKEKKKPEEEKAPEGQEVPQAA